MKATTREALKRRRPTAPTRCAHCDYSSAQVGPLVELDRIEHPGVYVCSRGEVEYEDGDWAPKVSK